MNIEIETLALPSNPALAQRAEDLARAAAGQDGIDPLSEQFLLGLRDERLGHRHFLAVEDGAVYGVAAVDGDQVELVVDPGHRRKGVGQALVDVAVDTLPTPAQLWAHGNLPAAQALAKRNELEVVRRLLVMSIEGEALRDAAGQGALDGELRIENYSDSVAAWGREHVESEWVRVNNEAFSWHPEQGGWDLERLHRGMEAEWFDPADVLLLWDTTQEGDPVLAGFHWLKWHTETEAEGKPPFGEVYVVGLAQDYRGRHLGGPLLSAGLQRMLDKGEGKGTAQVILYVEVDNEPAVKAYERLGFTVAEEHCVWARPTGGSD